MIDKKLLRMLGSNRKYIFASVAMMILGLLANITVTACICQAIRLAAQGAASYGGARAFVPLALLAAAGMGGAVCGLAAVRPLEGSIWPQRQARPSPKGL